MNFPIYGKQNCEKQPCQKNIPMIKSYAQYNTYNNNKMNLTVDNNAAVVFYKKVVEFGEKISLSNGKVQLKEGAYLILFSGVSISELGVELSVFSGNIFIAGSAISSGGQINLQTLIQVNIGGASIEIKNVSGHPVIFRVIGNKDDIIAPSIIIQEI